MIEITGEGETLDCGCEIMRMYPKITYGSASVKLCKEHNEAKGVMIPPDVPKLKCPHCKKEVI